MNRRHTADAGGAKAVRDRRSAAGFGNAHRRPDLRRAGFRRRYARTQSARCGPFARRTAYFGIPFDRRTAIRLSAGAHGAGRDSRAVDEQSRAKTEFLTVHRHADRDAEIRALRSLEFRPSGLPRPPQQRRTGTARSTSASVRRRTRSTARMPALERRFDVERYIAAAIRCGIANSSPNRDRFNEYRHDGAPNRRRNRHAGGRGAVSARNGWNGCAKRRRPYLQSGRRYR